MQFLSYLSQWYTFFYLLTVKKLKLSFHSYVILNLPDTICSFRILVCKRSTAKEVLHFLPYLAVSQAVSLKFKNLH